MGRVKGGEQGFALSRLERPSERLSIMGPFIDGPASDTRHLLCSVVRVPFDVDDDARGLRDNMHRVWPRDPSEFIRPKIGRTRDLDLQSGIG
jgi:hypothetical protein